MVDVDDGREADLLQAQPVHIIGCRVRAGAVGFSTFIRSALPSAMFIRGRCFTGSVCFRPGPGIQDSHLCRTAFRSVCRLPWP